MGNQHGLCTGESSTCCTDGDANVSSVQSRFRQIQPVELVAYRGNLKFSSDVVSPHRPLLALKGWNSKPIRDPVIQNLDSAFASCASHDSVVEEERADYGRIVRKLGLADGDNENSEAASRGPPQLADQRYEGAGGFERHGFGILTWTDGRRYEGQFHHGALQGHAVMRWPDDRKYVGRYHDNKKHGEGIFTWPDGRQYAGQWVDGERHGRGIYRNAKGESRLGQWMKDRPVGWENSHGTASFGGA